MPFMEIPNSQTFKRKIKVRVINIFLFKKQIVTCDVKTNNYQIPADGSAYK